MVVPNGEGRETMRAKAKVPSLATHAIGVRITAEQFAWLSRQPGTSGSVIRRLLDRELARVAEPGKGKVSRAELLEVAARITELAERVDTPLPEPVAVEASPRPTPVGEDAAENEGPQPPAPEPEAVAPVVEVEAAPVAGEPPAPGAELEPPPDLFASLPSPAPVGEASPVAEPEPEEPLYVVERWIADGGNGWSAKLARAILASLDAMRDLSDADLTVWVTETLHKRRSDFDAVVGRYLAAWLEARGEAAPVDENSARWARLAFAAELRAVLAKLEEVEVLPGT